VQRAERHRSAQKRISTNSFCRRTTTKSKLALCSASQRPERFVVVDPRTDSPYGDELDSCTSNRRTQITITQKFAYTSTYIIPFLPLAEELASLRLRNEKSKKFGKTEEKIFFPSARGTKGYPQRNMSCKRDFSPPPLTQSAPRVT
jgi:hypothetical protein